MATEFSWQSRLQNKSAPLLIPRSYHRDPKDFLTVKVPAFSTELEEKNKLFGTQPKSIFFNPMSMPTKETSGLNEDRSKNENYAMEGGVKFNPVPLINAATYLTAVNGINKIEKTQLNRRVFFQPIPQLSVRAIQDLTPEQLTAQDQAISEIQAESNTSDPVANLIAKGIAASTRGKARTEYIGQRVSQLEKERDRFDTETRENQRIAAETEAKNIDAAQQDADLKLQARTNAIAARQELNTGTLSQMAGNIEKTTAYNAAVDSANEEQRRTDAQDQINSYIRMAEQTKDEAKRLYYIGKAEEISTGYTRSAIPTWGEATKLTLKGRS